MKKSLRPIASVLVLAGLLLVSAAPATAAPRVEPVSEFTAPGLRLVAELWAWAGSWIRELPIESVRAPAGGAIDPDGQPATAGGPASGPSDTEREGRQGAPDPGT